MNEENNLSAILKRITGSRRRILIATTAIGIILLVTAIVVHELQIQAKQDFLAKKKAIQAYIKAGNNITSYSEFDYIRH